LAQRIAERVRDYLPGLIGIQFVSITAEEVVATLNVSKALCNTADVLHGGVLMAFADTLGGVGAWMNLPEASARTTTIESKTNFTAPAPLGTTVTGHCRRVHQGRTLSVWQTEVTDEQGALVAMVTQTQMVLNGK
jgi:uncharacterized protein (TIGR00369 family)